MNYHDAIAEALNGKWVKGSNFKNGLVITTGKSGYGVVVDVGNTLSVYDFTTGTYWPLQITKNFTQQDFKIVETRIEAEKNF